MQRIVAFFRLNNYVMPVERMHQLYHEIADHLRDRCGDVGVIMPDGQGTYFIAFCGHEAANMFEELLRREGRIPERTAELPYDLTPDLVVLGTVLPIHYFYGGYGHPN